MARFLLSGTKRNLAPMTTDADLQRAIAAIRRRRFDEAVTLLSRVLARQPNHLQAHWLMVQSLESQGQASEAIEQLRLLLIHARKDLAAIDQIAGHIRQRQYPLDHVLRSYAKFLEYQPDSATAAFNYAYNLSKAARFETAIQMYERALALGISAPEEVHLNIANICMDHLHTQDAARAHLQKALALNPSYSSAYYNLGNLAEQEGDRDAARSNFERCLQLDPTNESALARLADTQKFTRQDDALLQKLVTRATNSGNSDLHFAAGKAYEQLREFDKAWGHFSKGNELDRRAMPVYNAKQTEAHFARIASQCDSQWLKRFEGSSRDLVFICGMFRSGSTLLEQMLASHPGFVAGGESEFFPRLVAREFPGYPLGLDCMSAEKARAWQRQHGEQVERHFGGSVRVTDKRPDNFLYIGLIKAVLPSARFVVTERDWRDIATSVYSVRLGPSQSYATSLEDIRHYIRMQTNLVDHWEGVLGSDLVRVRYDDLVLQPKQTMTNLLTWLGEGWDERCLSFHEMKNSVRTASVWQVREPLHDKSIGRWKNYEKQFVEALGADVGA